MIHGKNGHHGFTLVELLLVLFLIALLASIVTPVVTKGIQQAKETALKDDLQTMRKAIDDYYTDKGHYPESLKTLVVDRYVRRIPDDPLTESDSSWRIIYDESGEGIRDLRSSAKGLALNNEFYSDW